MLLPFIAPILLIASVFIMVDSFGNPFFMQTRVGLGCKQFKLFKLRSMVEASKQQSKDYKTSANDSRITRVGRIVRKTSLDELPQIFNVLIGHMSFVGPRPDVPQMESLYTPENWKKRCSIRPGITGLAQSASRSAATPEERLHMDLTYMQRLSFWGDVKIVWMTAKKVLRLKGTN